MNAQKILDEIAKQGMIQTAIPNEEGGFIFVWAANAEEQLDALLNNDALEGMQLLHEWKKWADMGIEDFVPEFVKPPLNETYEKTEKFLS